MRSTITFALLLVCACDTGLPTAVLDPATPDPIRPGTYLYNEYVNSRQSAAQYWRISAGPKGPLPSKFVEKTEVSSRPAAPSHPAKSPGVEVLLSSTGERPRLR